MAVALLALVSGFQVAPSGDGIGRFSEVRADDSQITPDITKMPYHPIGEYAPGESIPGTLAPPTDPNPSGHWVAYDTNIFETLNFPGRQPGDTTDSDARGSGDPRHGFCPPSATQPEYNPYGKCANHQREYLDYFGESMKSILGDFGVVIKRYGFISPGSGLPPGAPLSAPGGQAYNIAAVVPGSGHADETVLVSGHYDFTDSGPAAAWDSAEGHTEVIRIAKIMADYWRATGTRPTATVKFIPWDSEESGTFGSLDYVENNIPPGEEDKVRAYFNMDPCAGAYPAFRRGNPADRVPEVLQLTNPNVYEDAATKARVIAFNARAETIIDEVFDNLDDEMTTIAGSPEIFVSDAEAQAAGDPGSSQRDEVVTALGGLALFSSDYANFAAVGIPIFNLFPDYFGLHADDTPGQNDGLSILHTPRDNLTTLNALTSADATGLTASEGWAKGMEMCAQIEGWYMLQPEMAGAEIATRRVVAYFEALPNEAVRNEAVTFNARGSYRYLDPATRTRVPATGLTYEWDFGDGTTGTGMVVDHAYARTGLYQATLTVRAADGARDSITIPITVVPSDFVGPVLAAIDPDAAKDGDFDLDWTFDGAMADLAGFIVEESRDFEFLLRDRAEGQITGKWDPSTPSDPRLQPWQKSEGSPAVNGNQFHSPTSSYWTGAFPTSPSPVDTQSVLTLKEPVLVPSSGQTVLSYWSLFQSEGDDEGRLEVAIDDGDPSTDPEEWFAVDGIGGFFSPTEPGGITDPEFINRKIDLARFKGKLLLVRFRYILGPEDRAASQPAGWYVDDIELTTGTWDQIGTTGADGRTFHVAGRANGLYGYRVVGRYQDGVLTQPSNVETARVTEAALPNLRVGTITASDTTPRKGQLITITAVIRNVGDAQAGPSVTRFQHDTGDLIDLVDTPAIPAGGQVTVRATWRADANVGTHQIHVRTDKTKRVAESDETDNRRSIVITIHR